MFKALVYTRLLALGGMWFPSNRSSARKRSPGFKVLMGILALYLLGCFFMMFYGMFASLAGPLGDAGLGWLYFAYVGIMAFALSFIGSVFTAQKQVFDAADNDLLLSMPIPPKYILGSRMLMLLLLTLVFELLVAVPAGAAWIMGGGGATAGGVASYIVCCLLLSLLVLTISCAFGYLLTAIISRVRRKTAITTALSLLFMAAYFYLIYNMNGYLSMLLTSSSAIGEAIHSSFYPAWAFGTAVAGGDVAALLGWAGICVIPFALVCVILSRSFIRVATVKRGAAKLKYTERTAKAASAVAALTRKELGRFTSNGMILMNTAIGGLFSLAAAVMLIVWRERVLAVAAVLPGDYAAALAAAAMGFLASSNTMSASSISLEGKNIWVVKAMPVSSGDILRAKVRMHDLMTVPLTVAAAVAAVIVLGPTGVWPLLILAAPALMGDFCAKLGVIVNLHFPKLDYTNEVAVVKQGMSIFITMLSSWGAALAPAALFFAVRSHIPAAVYVGAVELVFLAADLIMGRYLSRGAAALFEEL